MKAILHAKSSSGDPYPVEFLTENHSVRVFCHCQAGVLQRMCKHKLALIKGDARMLFNPEQTTLLSEVLSWPEFGTLKLRLEAYEKEINRLEIAKTELANEEKQIKARFAHGLTHGFV